MPPRYKLLDFSNRDRAEVMRFILNSAEVGFEDTKFNLPSEDWDEYKKLSHVTELPILEVDGTLLTKGKTILGYLAREYGYYGESNWECTLIDAMIDACEEFNQPTDAIFHTDDPEKQEHVKYFRDHTVPKVLDTIAKLAEHNSDKKGYIVGDNLTIADLMVCYSVELASSITHVKTNTILKNYPRLVAWNAHLQKSAKLMDWVGELFAVFVQQDTTNVNKAAKSPRKCAIM